MRICLHPRQRATLLSKTTSLPKAQSGNLLPGIFRIKILALAFIFLTLQLFAYQRANAQCPISANPVSFTGGDVQLSVSGNNINGDIWAITSSGDNVWFDFTSSPFNKITNLHVYGNGSITIGYFGVSSNANPDCTINFTINNGICNDPPSTTKCSECNPDCEDCPPPAITDNPDLNASCEDLKIAFILDESGSMSGFTSEVKDGVLAFLSALKCTGAKVIIYEFSSEDDEPPREATRRVVSSYTLIDDALITSMTNYFDGSGTATYDPVGGTNWENAIKTLNADITGGKAVPNLTFMLTDGNPTFNDATSDQRCQSGSGSADLPDIINAMLEANVLKGKNSHFFTLGAGGKIDFANLKRISGPTEYDPNTNSLGTSDYALESFDQLAACLTAFAFDLCPLIDPKCTAEAACEDESNGSISFGVNGQNGVSYNWQINTNPVQSGNLTSPNYFKLIEGLEAGLYKITVKETKSDGCERKEVCEVEVEKTEPEEPKDLACWEIAKLNPETCQWEVTGAQPPIPTLECWQTAEFNHQTCKWVVSGTQPAKPTLECWQTAEFNHQTCKWVVSGTQPAKPTLECWQTAEFNHQTCKWVVSGTQPAKPTLECWQTAEFNHQTCKWVVSGTQPPKPTLECWQTAEFNHQTCKWVVSGTQPAKPTLECWQTAEFNHQTCKWVVSGTQPPKPTLECWQTAEFNHQTCKWVVSGTQPPKPTLECWQTAEFNHQTCKWVVSGTQPAKPTLECWQTAEFNHQTCKWVVSGTQPPKPTLECWQTAEFNHQTCKWVVSGTQPPKPTLECWQTAEFNHQTCKWVVSGTQPAKPTLECWQTAEFNHQTCKWVVSGTQPPKPTLECWQTAEFNHQTCKWVVSGTQPPKPTLECWQTAEFNHQTCKWVVSGTQPPKPTLECWQTAEFNHQTCKWVVSGTQPAKPTLECWQTAEFNHQTCKWVVSGTQPPKPTLECWQTAEFNHQTCKWVVSGTQPAKPTLECWQTAEFNHQTCKWVVSGTQPAKPTLECWQTAEFNHQTCKWVVSGSQPPKPTIECWQTAIFNPETCIWNVTGEQPDCVSEKCETAYARAREDADCFSKGGFSNWGWTNELQEGDYSMELYSGAGQCNIGKGLLVGELLISYNGNKLEVTYNMFEGNILTESHLYVGCEQFPIKKNGKKTVAPGQYPYSHGHGEVNSYTYAVDVSKFKCNKLHLIAHAVVCSTICPEDCDDEEEPGEGCETAFAKSDEDGTCFREDGFSRWGWTNGPIKKTKDQVWELYAGAGQCDIGKGELVGHLHLSFNGNALTVSYKMIEGFSLGGTHLYVGCGAYPQKNGKNTVAPGQFPYKKAPAGDKSLVQYKIDISDMNCHKLYVIAHAETCKDEADHKPDKKSETGKKGKNKGRKNKGLLATPNPTSGMLNLEITTGISERAVIRLIDIQGRLLRQNTADLFSGYNKVEMDLSSLATGVYFISVQTADEILTTKVVVTKM